MPTVAQGWVVAADVDRRVLATLDLEEGRYHARLVDPEAPCEAIVVTFTSGDGERIDAVGARHPGADDAGAAGRVEKPFGDEPAWLWARNQAGGAP